MRDRFRDCAAFRGKYDQNSFDPDYDTQPLEAFEQAVREVGEHRIDVPLGGLG